MYLEESKWFKSVTTLLWGSRTSSLSFAQNLYLVLYLSSKVCIVIAARYSRLGHAHQERTSEAL
jgi:hypothetical protein